MVMLMPKDPAVWGLDGQPEQVREGGRFELRGVSPGSYILSVEQFGETGNQRLSARLPIEVRDGNIDGIEMALSPGVEVTGQVGYEGGAPNTKVGSNESNTPPKVILEPRNQTLTLGVTGGLIEENGRFKLTGVGPDIYGVDIAGLPPDSYIKTVRLGSTEITGAGLDFNQGGASGELSIVVSNSGGQIEGTVEQGENQRVAGIQVVAVPEGAKREQMRLFKLSSTAENGHFELKGLAPGEYLLFAFEQIEPGAYRDPAFLKPLEDKGSRVAIEEKSRKSVVLKAIPAGTSSTVR